MWVKTIALAVGWEVWCQLSSIVDSWAGTGYFSFHHVDEVQAKPQVVSLQCSRFWITLPIDPHTLIGRGLKKNRMLCLSDCVFPLSLPEAEGDFPPVFSVETCQGFWRWGPCHSWAPGMVDAHACPCWAFSCGFLPRTDSSRSFSSWVLYWFSSWYLPVCLSNSGGSGLPWGLSSLMNLIRAIDFQFVLHFYCIQGLEPCLDSELIFTIPCSPHRFTIN